MTLPQDEIGVQLQELVRALQENGRNTQEDRRQVSQKLDDLARKQDDMRRDASLAMDTLRRDFERLFVPIAKYDPEHLFIMGKIKEYDDLLKNSRTAQDEYTRYKTKTDQNATDIAEIKKHKAALGGRVVAWIGLGVSLVSMLIYIATFIILYSQHISIH